MLISHDLPVDIDYVAVHRKSNRIIFPITQVSFQLLRL